MVEAMFNLYLYLSKYTTLLTISLQKYISQIQLYNQNMKTEIEAKIRLESFDEVSAKLPKVSFRRQKNIYLKDNKGNLIRVRYENNRIILNRKKDANLNTPFKAKQEEECAVKDLFDVLRFLGYEKVLSYEKKRADIRLHSCIVSLDILPDRSCFIEVEGNENNIKKVLSHLELNNHVLENKSYFEILGGRSDGTE
jgi:adenylate cyclase class IV